jgi:hypothetical protein
MSLPWDTPLPPPGPRPQGPSHAAPEPLTQQSFEPQVGSLPEDGVDESWFEEIGESTPWFTRGFWAATAVRAIRTFAQTMVATITAAGVGVFSMHWYDSVLTSAGAALLSLLMSVDRNVRS